MAVRPAVVVVRRLPSRADAASDTGVNAGGVVRGRNMVS